MSENNGKKNVFKAALEKVKDFFKSIADCFTRVIENVKNMERKNKIILAVISIVVLVLLVVLIVSLTSRYRYGNTAGNINNAGYVVKDGSGVVLSYVNTYDSSEETEKYQKSGVYGVKSNGKVKTYETFEDKIYAYSINKVGNWVYYMKIDENNSTRDIVKTNGKKRIVLVDNMSSYEENTEHLLENYELLQVAGKYVYYINENLNITRIKTNGKEKTIIRDEIKVSDFQVYKDYIYINNIDGEFIKVSLKDFEDETMLKNINANNFQVEGKYIYYIDKANKLVRTNLDGEEEKVIVDKEVKSFNVVKNDVYYFAEYKAENAKEGAVGITNAYAIFKLNVKKNETTKVVNTEASYSNINVAGKWIYYNDKIANDYYYYTIYRVKVDGTEKEDLAGKVSSAEVKEYDVAK